MSESLKMVLSSSRMWVRLLVLVGASLGGVAAAGAQQFSADLVVTHGEAPASAGKLRVRDGKVRLETPDLADGFFLIDGARPNAMFVRPASRIFMEARQSSRLTQLFVPVDPADPCAQWQAMAKVAGVPEQGAWHCERVGEESIGGRDATIVRAVSSPGLDLVGWVDPVLKFPLRIKTADGAIFTAENLREEPQPAEAFVIPAGFRKFDPQALIQQIKQSDVWVEAPAPR